MATYDTNSVDTISFLVLAHGLIVAGAIFRAIFCLIKMMTAEENAGQYKRRLIHAVVIVVIAQAAFSMKNLIFTYFA